MTLPIIILGAGGHSKVLINILLLQSRTILGIADIDSTKRGSAVLGIPVLGTDDVLKQHLPNTIQLVNGIASTTSTKIRWEIFEKCKGNGYSFTQVIHPSAIIAKEVRLGEGVQIMAGTVIQPSVHILENTIINTGTLVDHDCQIGAHVHIAPGVTLSGDVMIGDGSHIGTGTNILQGVRIGRNVLVGAGTLVNINLANDTKVRGVPAKVF